MVTLIKNQKIMDKKYKILVIDDKKLSRGPIVSELKSNNFEIIEAEDGEVGIMSSFYDHPDLILLDIVMPKIDGVGVMEKLRNDPWGKNVPLIILTSEDTSEKLLKAIEEFSPVFYLIKDKVDPAFIVKKVKEALNLF